MGEVIFGADKRDSVFGYGTYISPYIIKGLSIEGRAGIARDLGWSGGCPVAKSLTNPSNQEFGPDRMIKRYSETNQWFSIIIRRAENNRKLREELLKPIPRLKGEEPIEGKYEPESVPLSYLTQMAPMTSIYGYAAPRLLLEIQKPSSDRSTTEQRIDLISRATLFSYTPQEMLVLLTKEAVKLGADPVQVLGHVLSREVLDEENCRMGFIKLAEALQKDAPDVHKVYNRLSPSQKAERGIAEIPLK